MNADTEARLSLGINPTRFWINSMGEYGHLWTDGSDTVGGSINLKEAVESAGLSWSEHAARPPQDLIDRAYEQELANELLDPREHIVYRLWKHLQPLSSDLWRFYGGFVYPAGATTDLPEGPHLSLEVEYFIFEKDRPRLEALAAQFGGVVDEMRFDDEEGKTQYGVMINVLGKSFGEVGNLQLQWWEAALEFESDVVSVL